MERIRFSSNQNIGEGESNFDDKYVEKSVHTLVQSRFYCKTNMQTINLLFSEKFSGTNHAEGVHAQVRANIGAANLGTYLLFDIKIGDKFCPTYLKCYHGNLAGEKRRMKKERKIQLSLKLAEQEPGAAILQRFALCFCSAYF